MYVDSRFTSVAMVVVGLMVVDCKGLRTELPAEPDTSRAPRTEPERVLE